MKSKYSLILGALPRNDYYLAGWLAGSVIAHKIYCDQWGKVFWVCPLKLVGIRPEDKKLIQEGKALGSLIEDYGFFYDGKDEAISWMFDIETILTDQEIHSKSPKTLSKYRKYIGFRQVYFDEPDDSFCWVLIKNIRRIGSPYQKKLVQKTQYQIPSFKRAVGNEVRTITTQDFMQGGAVFSCEYPKHDKIKIIDYHANTVTDLYLKELFLSKDISARLKEHAVQLAFALKLMQDNKWSLVMEKQLQNKERIDMLFKEGNDLVAVEIKRSDNDDPVNQLKGYIRQLRKNRTIANKYGRIKGVVLCGRASSEMKAQAKKEGFKLMQYSLCMEFNGVR